MEAERIGLRHVREIGSNTTLWDESVVGFGIRRQRSKAVVYFLHYRTKDGRKRWLKIGRHGAGWTCDTARARAQELLGEVAAGKDPAGVREKHRGATVGDLCDRYLEAAKAGRILTRSRRPKKRSTLATDEGRIKRHIKPLLGRLPVAAVTRLDIEQFMADVAKGKTAARVKTKKRGLAVVEGGKGTSSRTVGLLGGIFTYAIRQGMRPDNPVRGVERPADGVRKRRLTRAEYRALGHALRQSGREMWPPAVAAVWFLALTGWRKGEATNLKWSEVDLEKRLAVLGDSKSGESVRALSSAACDVIRGMRKFKRNTDDLVFPGSRENAPLGGFGGTFEKICAQSGLPDDITLQTLRHSFGSEGGDLEYSDITIGTLIGHRNLGAGAGSVTRKVYVHRADPVLLAAADRIAGEILSRMNAGARRAAA